MISKLHMMRVPASSMNHTFVPIANDFSQTALVLLSSNLVKTRKLIDFPTKSNEL